MATDQQHFSADREWQAYFDEALAPIGMRAPVPVLGQEVDAYRRETYRQLKRTYLPPVHELAQVNYRGLRADALDVFGPQLLKACVQEYRNPAHLAPGELRAIEVRDPQTGRVQHREWIGQESFVKAMGRPGRRVVRFMAPVDSMNRAIREFA
jgi:hypothetical protein